MLTIEGLKRTIGTAEDLRSIVKTMKALAAVNIRQLEEAVASLQDYMKTVELGLQVVLQSPESSPDFLRSAPRKQLGVLAFGSDQGMCGQLNEQIMTHTHKAIQSREIPKSHVTLAVIGNRVAGRLEDLGYTVQRTIEVPGSIDRVTPVVQSLLVMIEEWNSNRDIDTVLLCYCKHESMAVYRPTSEEILPIDQTWFQAIKERRWPGRSLPQYRMDPETLFSMLIRQYLFASLFQACAESMASENASRLASMQGAEKNIAERLDELTGLYHQQRQMAITGELLDIVSGFEALSSSS